MAKDKLFLDTDVALDHLADRQPFAEHAHRLLGLVELQEVEACLASLSFSHLYYLLRKGRTHPETLALLAKLKRLTKLVAVGEKEIQAPLARASALSRTPSSISRLRQRAAWVSSSLVTKPIMRRAGCRLCRPRNIFPTTGGVRANRGCRRTCQ